MVSRINFAMVKGSASAQARAKPEGGGKGCMVDASLKTSGWR
jgi:hypothetical protein